MTTEEFNDAVAASYVRQAAAQERMALASERQADAMDRVATACLAVIEKLKEE